MEPVLEHLADRLIERQRAVYDVLNEGRLYDNVVNRVDGRRIRVGTKWLDDFASCNYLGLDLREEIIESVVPELRRWGTHPSWARMAASPEIYEELEEEIANLLGVESTIVLPTISLIAVGLIPALAGKGGVILADRTVHKVNHDGCRLARDMGAKLVSFRHDQLDGLESLLQEHQSAPSRLIVVDGILSVTGRCPDLAAMATLARRYDAILYIDDAHGFGVIGEDPTETTPYGRRGNGVVKHLGLSYENIIYVAGLSKAYSSLGAFVACPKALKSILKCNITSYLVSGPIPTAALATALAGLRLNATEGDRWRARLHAQSTRIYSAYVESGVQTDNDNQFPILSAYVGSNENVIQGGKALFDRGVYVTLQGYPLVPRGKGVLRATPTVANTDEQVEHLIDSVKQVTHSLGVRA